MTKIQEAYQTLQAEWVRVNDVRVGDRVKIKKDFVVDALGSDSGIHKASEMVRRIARICNDRIVMESPGWFCPFFVLEITAQPRETTIEVRTRYYKDGVDVTDKISDETKANLAK